MTPYKKIYNIFKTVKIDLNNEITNLWDGEKNPHWKKIYKFGEYYDPTVEQLQEISWIATEKVDGTNIRVILHENAKGLIDVVVKGRSDSAEVKQDLEEHILQLVKHALTKDFLDFSDGKTITFYGEGYGAGIGKGGGAYGSTKKFIVFDCKIDDHWLDFEKLTCFCKELELPLVPVLQEGILPGIIEDLESGYLESKLKDSEDFEGIVCRPKIDLYNYRKERIITKIKKEFMPS